MKNKLAPRAIQDHHKDFLAIKHWLLGRNYAIASYALELASQYHTHTRKDGTYELNHQCMIAAYVRSLNAYLTYPEETFAAVFLHDLPEDHPVTFEQIREIFRDKIKSCERAYKKEGLEEFNLNKMMSAVRHLTKVVKGKKLTNEEYFKPMEEDEIASVVKGADRIHNLLSMGEAFSLEKKKSYIQETEDFILPMIKQAQKNFPHQNNAYENEKLVLKTQINIIELSFKSEENKK